MNLFGILNMQAPGDFSPNGATQLSPGHHPGIRAAMRIFAREFPQEPITKQIVSQFCIDPASLQTDQLTAQVKQRFAVMGSNPQPSGRRSEPIPARSADGLKVRLRAGNSVPPSRGGLKVRADHPGTLAPGICADLRPASSCFHVRNPARTRVPLARPQCPDWADIGSDLRPEQAKYIHDKTLALDVQNEYVAFLTSQDQAGKEVGYGG